MRQQDAIYQARKTRQDISKFLPYMDGGPGAFQLPANAKLFVMAQGPTPAGTVVMVAGAKNIACPALLAGQVYELGWFELGVTIEPVDGAAICIDIGLGEYVEIGTPGA